MAKYKCSVWRFRHTVFLTFGNGQTFSLNNASYWSEIDTIYFYENLWGNYNICEDFFTFSARSSENDSVNCKFWCSAVLFRVDEKTGCGAPVKEYENFLRRNHVPGGRGIALLYQPEARNFKIWNLMTKTVVHQTDRMKNFYFPSRRTFPYLWKSCGTIMISTGNWSHCKELRCTMPHWRQLHHVIDNSTMPSHISWVPSYQDGHRCVHWCFCKGNFGLPKP